MTSDAPRSGMDLRGCTDCAQYDADPKHILVLPDETEVHHHLDCGARRSPPCELCAPQLVGWDGTTGDGLRQHILGRQ